ncbi:peptidase inhibitor family I36 protein [Mobiluncus mulieris]
MGKQILGAAMTLAAAVSMSLLAIPSATAVDDSLDDSLAVNAVEETTDDATPEAGDETLPSEDSGISVRQATGCPRGYACLWQYKDYRGYPWNTSSHRATVGGNLNNNSNSAAANGRCKKTYFYDNDDLTGHYFYLASQHRVGGNYQDPFLRNGAGKGPFAHENWENRIGSIKFDDCK